MGSPLLFGLPSSHFDIALLCQPTASLRRRVPMGLQEEKDFEGHGPSKTRPPTLFYNSSMIEDCLSNVHQWLMEHTWISWYIRDGRGNLRAVWNPGSICKDRNRTEPRWRGYCSAKASADDKADQSDRYGRILPERLRDKDRTSFDRTLADYPYRVSYAEPTVDGLSTSKDKVYLQFWTWSAFLKLYPFRQSPHAALGQRLCRYDITDYTGDWCGTIVLDKEWGDKQEPGSEHEFLAISEAKNFTPGRIIPQGT